MCARRSILLVGIWLAGWSSIALASTPEVSLSVLRSVQEQRQLADQAHRQGNYFKAEKLLLKALATAQSDPESKDQVLVVLSDLGAVETRGNKGNEAVQHLQEALTLAKTVLWPLHPDYLRILNRLAQAYARQGNYAMAVATYRQLVAAHEATEGDDRDHERALVQLQTLQYEHGDPIGLNYTLTRLIKLRKRLYGPNGGPTGYTHYFLAGNYLQQGQTALARKHFIEAIRILDRHPAPDIDQLAREELCAALVEFGDFEYEQGHFDHCIQLYLRSLTVRKQYFGPDAWFYKTMSMLYKKYAQLGRCPQARQLRDQLKNSLTQLARSEDRTFVRRSMSAADALCAERTSGSGERYQEKAPTTTTRARQHQSENRARK